MHTAQGVCIIYCHALTNALRVFELCFNREVALRYLADELTESFLDLKCVFLRNKQRSARDASALLAAKFTMLPLLAQLRVPDVRHLSTYRSNLLAAGLQNCGTANSEDYSLPSPTHGALRLTRHILIASRQLSPRCAIDTLHGRFAGLACMPHETCFCQLISSVAWCIVVHI